MKESKDMNNKSLPVETERKYLIRMPDKSKLEAVGGVRVVQITQTYLHSKKGITLRIRKQIENGNAKYVMTEKKRISDLSCIEVESSVSQNEYEKLIKEQIPGTSQIQKTRYIVPYGSFFWEIDVYPFWKDRAIAEIELKSENQSFEVPELIHIIREVSSDVRYKNRKLAENIPFDDISE